MGNIKHNFSLCVSSSEHMKGLDEEVQGQSGYYSEDTPSTVMSGVSLHRNNSDRTDSDSGEVAAD